jgi:hypothetical protein
MRFTSAPLWENRRNVRKTVENNLIEDSDQYDCSDEDDYFEGSIKHIVKIGKVKAVSRQSDTFITMNFVSIPHVAFRTTVLNSPFTERKF